METPSSYKERIKRHSPPSPYLKNSLFAFISGGTVCLFGELLATLFIKLGIENEDSYLLVTVSLIFIASLLTGLGIFDKIARFAGAGTLVPVTGFANSVVSPAIDTKAEGLILGVGAKIFTVSGPVILYGILAGTIYGTVLWVVNIVSV